MTPAERTLASGLLTMTTDFGGDGPYVASMKGVVLGLAPGARIVDVSHAIPPQDLREGAFLLAAVVDSFPKGTVHLAVVDPGVGTDRRVIAVEVAGQWFVLPDNGLIGEVVRHRTPSAIRVVTNPLLRLPNVSSTFHGRDIMAPAAAHLVNGGDPAELGPLVDSLIPLPANEPVENEGGLAGEVIFVDSFGNLITNITSDRPGPPLGSALEVEILGRSIGGIARTYGDRSPGTLMALIGSMGRMEVAVVNGHAARFLSAGRGTAVLVRRNREPEA